MLKIISNCKEYEVDVNHVKNSAKSGNAKIHGKSKVKTLAAVDTEKVASIQEFIENVVTESRLNQGIDYLKEQNQPLNQTSTGIFLKWIVGDVIKEESDTMRDSLIEPKDVNGSISKKAREWYFSQVFTWQ